MSEAKFKNFRNKVGRDGSRSSTAPLLPAEDAPSPNTEVPKIDNTKLENEGAESSESGQDGDVFIDNASLKEVKGQYVKPEPLKRKSIATDKPTVYIEVETTGTTPWKIKAKDKSSVVNTSLSTIPNNDEAAYKLSDDDEELVDWCHLGPLKEKIAVSMSAFYGIFVMVLGIVVPVAETFAGKRNPDVFELYYIYLYVMSIFFLVFLYRDKLLCRTNTCRSRMSRLCPSKGSYPVNEESVVDKENEKGSNKTVFKTGSYLRIGAMAFGIGSMVHSGLHFGQYFQVFDGTKTCHHIALAIKPFMHLVFTFLQLYFIFMFSTVRIQTCRTTVRFGLIHMCGTNICIWCRVIIIQTINIIQKFHLLGNLLTADDTPVVMTTTSTTVIDNRSHSTGRSVEMVANKTYNTRPTLYIPESGCYWYGVMGFVLENADPYLYPCTIQYSLVCAGILYAMWSSVGRVLRKKGRKLSTISKAESSLDSEKYDVKKSRMDCKHSSRGLFLGILISVCAIITMIAFHVLRKRESMNGNAVILVHLSETALYLLMTLAVILAAERMKTLGFKKNKQRTLDDTLLITSFTGLLLFAMFSVFAAFFETGKPHAVLTILTNLFMIIQASLQTVFLLAGEQMTVKNSSQEQKKNGREFVIFLLLCNFSMWAMNTFETQQPEHNPLQIKFYGIFTWSIITFITVPLGLFYRFISALWLMNIWKNTWKLKQR